MSNDANSILNAFINEARSNGIADFTKITPETMKISETNFYKALRELEKLGYISNIIWTGDMECLCDDISINTPSFKLK